MLSSMAQDESESISKNVKWSIQQRIEAGTFKFGYPPYGYTKDANGNYVIEPTEMLDGICGFMILSHPFLWAICRKVRSYIRRIRKAGQICSLRYFRTVIQ